MDLTEGIQNPQEALAPRASLVSVAVSELGHLGVGVLPLDWELCNGFSRGLGGCTERIPPTEWFIQAGYILTSHDSLDNGMDA